MAQDRSAPIVPAENLGHPHRLRLSDTGEQRCSFPFVLSWALAAGLVGGIAAWLAGEAMLDRFKPALEQVEVMGSKQWVVTIKTGNQAATRNGMLAAGLLGASLGLALGLAGGLARRALRAAMEAGAMGLMLGAGASALMAFWLFPVLFDKKDPISGDLVFPLLMIGAVWSAAGLTGGLAFGIGLGPRDYALRAACGGLVGAMLAAIVFEVIGALTFPHDKTDEPISATWTTRLLARLVVAVFAAVGAALAVQTQARRNRPATTGAAEPEAARTSAL